MISPLSHPYKVQIDHYMNCLSIAEAHGFAEQIRYFRRRILELLADDICYYRTAIILQQLGIPYTFENGRFYV